MMKLIAFFFLAVVAVASAGGLGEGPEVYSAVTTKQVHSPFAKSFSTRVQSFNDATYIAPVVAAAPAVHSVAYAAPAVHSVAYSAPAVHSVAYSAPAVAYSAPVVAKYAAAAPLAISSYSYGAGYGYGHGW